MVISVFLIGIAGWLLYVLLGLARPKGRASSFPTARCHGGNRAGQTEQHDWGFRWEN